MCWTGVCGWPVKPSLSAGNMGAGASAPLEARVGKAGTSWKCADPYRAVYTECIAVLEEELSRLGTRTLDDQQSLRVMRLVRSRYGEVLDSMIRPPAWSVPEVLVQSGGHSDKASESCRATPVSRDPRTPDCDEDSDGASAAPMQDDAPTLRLLDEECEPQFVQEDIEMRRRTLSISVTQNDLEKKLVDLMCSVHNSGAVTPDAQVSSPEPALRCPRLIVPPEAPANSPAPRSHLPAPSCRSIFRPRTALVCAVSSPSS